MIAEQGERAWKTYCTIVSSLLNLYFSAEYDGLTKPRALYICRPNRGNTPPKICAQDPQQKFTSSSQHQNDKMVLTDRRIVFAAIALAAYSVKASIKYVFTAMNAAIILQHTKSATPSSTQTPA